MKKKTNKNKGKYMFLVWLLIGVALIGLIAVSIFEKEKGIEQTTWPMYHSCLDAVHMEIIPESSCYNFSSKEVYVTILRGSSEKFWLAGMDFLLFGGEDSKKEYAYRLDYNQGEVRVYPNGNYGDKITLPDREEKVIYIINASGMGKVDEIWLVPYAIIDEQGRGDKYRRCDPSGKVALRECGERPVVPLVGLGQ